MKKATLLLLFTIHCSLFTLTSQTSHWLWARQPSVSANTTGTSIATDATGNVYAIGTFAANVSFGSTTLTNATSGNFFLAKYNSAGTALWARKPSGTATVVATSVTTDASNNVFVTGYYNGTSFDSLRFGNTSFLCNASETGMFLVKYDSNGNILWAVNAVNNNTMQANSVTTDAAGNAYVTGFFTSGPLIFGTDTLRSLTSAMFLVKYNSSGNLIWALGGSDYTEAWSVTTDASNNVLVTGYFYNTTVLFGTITLTDLGLKNIYTVKYSPSGTILWAKHFGGTLIETANAITTDAANNAYVTGFFRDTVPIHFGPDTVFTPLLANSTTYYMYLLKYDSSGTEQWARTAGLINYTTQGFSVSCDASGVYVSGDFFGPHVVFGNDTLLFGGAAKAPLFLVKYDFNGHVQCATRLDAEDNNAVATDDFGNAYITGTFFTNSFVAGSDTLQTLSTSFVVAKYTCITSHEGVTELINNENIDMFPNPTTSTFNVSSSGTIESLKVYNILGDIIRNYELGIKNGGSATIDMSSYTTGLYFVEIKTGKGIVRKKLIKE